MTELLENVRFILVDLDTLIGNFCLVKWRWLVHITGRELCMLGSDGMSCMINLLPKLLNQV